MKVYLATDHTGFELKNKVKEFLGKEGYEVEDCGAFAYHPDDDYPDFISKAAQKVSENPDSVGIIFGGSGQGEAMAANKYPNVRCALFYASAIPVQAADISGRQSLDPFEILKLTRDHNHANILSIGVRFLREEDILKAIKVWLNTPFSKDERHIRRVEKIKKLEDTI
ncbi:MAG: RpiB/LacA/LacB family sugar-phosphate isomerase [bacterium]|nr:RpiB/LacA/LacB family sugar-phosphate isomerase [bacterium]